MRTHSLTVTICAVALHATGCTTEPDAGRSAPSRVDVPPPEISVDLPLEEAPSRSYPEARACQLAAQDCAGLDSRPFEPCLAGTASCKDKGTGELLPVDKAARGEPARRSR